MIFLYQGRKYSLSQLIVIIKKAHKNEYSAN